MNSRTRFVRRRWFQILVGGILLFVAAEQALRVTGNPNFFPTLLLLGAFVVPITFVAYFYEQERAIDRGLHLDAPFTTVTLCFPVGGVVGVVTAGLVEYKTLSRMGTTGLFGVAAIEEAAKLIFPVALFMMGRYRSEADGLLIGVASGMGFAALETMGYGLVTIIVSQGSVGTLEQVLFIRGLFSPAGHAAWTGLVCAVLWRERERKPRGMLNLAAMAAFVVAVALHSVWNIVNGVGGSAVVRIVVTVAGSLTIAVISLALLFRRVRESRRPARLEPAIVDDLSSL